MASCDAIGLDTSFGAIELVGVDVGGGFPVLSLYGTGGGFGQGLALADGLRDVGYRAIAPARFGYLGAPIPERPDVLARADAFAELLDQLAVDRAIVMGASAGAITALAFAERYPERTAALLVMVPAYDPPEQAAPEPWSSIRTRAVTTALRSHFLFWAGMRLAPIGTAPCGSCTTAMRPAPGASNGSRITLPPADITLSTVVTTSLDTK